ncbi:Transcriptional regulator/sugar kinase OS=Singulisphaera acidiphila (strain ATCC BAA-1392 / DSM 18658 / VKM B-2454 / MOB10) GN=Sinac_1796 PE=4 SV=1: ROK [Gemmataceae bacterium]|nr:Transcriptional regulator/sugar kinase OS=Singulisphaera acidiphila (strain ATCC BAA-1392 / DSM 18658 / VKM B-2454 / MOB10) GN=Sinac_1796 PE=4 SV=1: ROK [Gemmataceae bacterium]VTT99112.1 Transcriptional regulator/sugar kinase OS=Singulisphaera acidiphila (strain ATCC BAA-1392 / DSM 18658 / VKM B-2454 / MOB10) GN=Sinac_1796 PE=4 SV=1: ROK [Gemmataceae bacterium]
MSAGYWLGVDLGGTKILSGLFDDDLKLLARSKQPTSAEGGPTGVFGRIVQGVDAVVREANIDPGQIRGMGIGIPGQIDLGTTRVKFAPNLDWRDVDLKPLMPAAWRWPLVVENDVRMGTYGEFAHGAAQGAKNVLGVFVGTGVGGGLILNGELYSGFNGNAGEIGHLVVHWRQGTDLEAIAGRKHMMKRAKDILDDAPKRVRKEWKGIDLGTVRSSQLAEYYQKDDPIAVQLVDDAARALGAALGGVVNFLSPEVIVIGGGVTGALGDSFIERIWEIAQRYTLPGAANGVKCVSASLGDDSGIIGCAAYAKSHSPLRAAEVA